MGADLCYARVVKVSRKMIRVVDEHGNEAWRYPWFFNRKVEPHNVEQMREEGSLKL